MNDYLGSNNYNPLYPPGYTQVGQGGYPPQGSPAQQGGYTGQQPYPQQNSVYGGAQVASMYTNQQTPYPTANNYQQQNVHRDQKVPDRKSVASKSIEFVYVVLIAMESLMAMRFVFKLLGADRGNGFILFLYNMTELFVGPFNGIFSYSVQNRTGVYGFEAEWTVLVAMGVYAILAFLVVKLIDLFR